MPLAKPDIGYIPTPPEVVQAVLTLARLTQNDVLYDLGCGDGRVVIAASQEFSTRGVGIDIDSERIREARENAASAGVSSLVEFRQENLFESDLTQATVVFLYLLPHLNLKLRPRLFHQLKPGTRVVSHDFNMDDWKPEEILKVQTTEDESTLFSWVVGAVMPSTSLGDRAS